MVIPTYNRRASLLRTLAGLRRQNYPAGSFEVIVVDDGSSEELSSISWSDYPFKTHYIRQENAGAAAARNAGATRSRAPFVIFLDDDIVLARDALTHIIAALRSVRKLIVLGVLIPVVPASAPPFAKLYCAGQIFSQETQRGDGQGWVPYTACKTGLLGMRRLDFLALNGFQDPTGGWPNWDDVDFGYRAHRRGFHFWRSTASLAYHHDRSLLSFEATCERLRRAYHAAARLIRRYPEMAQDLPPLHDKTPISWREDTPALILRKLLRHITATSPALRIMGRLTRFLERYGHKTQALALLYRWQLSACLYQGYRAGLQEETRIITERQEQPSW